MDFYKMMEWPNRESKRIAELILFQFDESLKSKIEQYLNWLFDIECMLDDTAGMYKNQDNDEGFLFHWEYRTDKIREKLDSFLNLQPLKLQLLLLKILLNIDMNRDTLNEKNYPFIHWRDNHFLKEIILQKQKSIVSRLPKANDFLHIKHLQGKKEFSMSDISLMVKGFSEKNQVLIIHILNENKNFQLFKLHQNITDRANIIAQNIGRNESNIYKFLTQIGTKDQHPEYYNYKRLKNILPLFKYLQLSDIENYIELKIDKVKPNW
jgi:hypothetical protein